MSRHPLALALALVAVTLAGVTAVAPAAMAEGPWRGQIVDAETAQPLHGVVVLFYWIKYTSTPAGWAGGDFHDAAEVVTGPDGRFVIPARWTFTLVPWNKVSREMVIFKPGYGRWRFRGSDQWERLPTETRAQRYEAARKQLGEEGVVIELPPLKTREARLNFYNSLRWSGVVPAEAAIGMEEAKNRERLELGLGR
jgi:hypothetical protein